jgi:N-sulfoglucosamine sulfohydrolase
MSPHPNIVLIHGHDIGRYLGAYGRRVETPHLEALAETGVRFTSYFCPAPQCSPSRASMMTGRYPHNNGMMGLAHLDWALHDPKEALPHRLKALGYETYLFGEQHEASSGEILGYDRSFGTKWPQLAREVAPAFANYLENLGQPFFASVGFFEAHRPFDHPGPVPERRSSLRVYKDDKPEEVEVLPYLPDTAEVRKDIAALNGRVKAADEGVGMVIRALEDRGLRENTVVIFTTDHGVAFPRAKGTLYDAGLEVAFIASWPGHFASGEDKDELLCNIDLAATLLELLGANIPETLDGRSFLSLLKGEAGEVRDHFFCEMTWHDRYNPVRGVRTNRWKYIRHYSAEPEVYLPADVKESPSGREVLQRGTGALAREELYDLASDPLELDNLIDDETYADVADALSRRVSRWMEETSDPLFG